MTVPGDHLARRGRCQPQRRADVRFDGGFDVRVRPDRAGELADRDGRPRLFEPDPVAFGLQAEEPELRPKGRRFGVHAVGTPDGRRRGELRRATTQHVDQPAGGPDEEIAGAAERHRQRGVDDVGRGQPVMDPRALRRPDGSAHDVDERGEVVVRHPLTFGDGGDEGCVDPRRAARAAVATSLVTAPKSDQPSRASSSISSQSERRASSVNRAAISGSA